METCSSMKSSKQKLKREDIISLLPDAVLHHILSFLDMKFVMKTSLLAKRWRDLWRSVPTLDFDFSTFVNPISASRDDDVRFLNFIDQIFIHHDRSDIDKFSINYVVDPVENDLNVSGKLYSWVLASIRRGVQELVLQVNDNYIIHLPLCLFHCRSLVTLLLNINSDFNNEPIHLMATTFDLPNLKTLLLNRVIFSDENSTKAIFSKCPVLESLHLTCCSILKGKTFHISVPSLKHLKIDRGFHDDDEEWNICSPNLTLLSLTLSAQMVEIISAPRNVSDGFATQFLNLRIMHLRAWLDDGWSHAIIHLLRISPNVETLTLSLIEESSLHHPDVLMNKANFVCNDDFAYIGQCIFHGLKYVRIQGVQGWANELKFLEILLKCSTVLEKIVIISADSKERLIEFGEKVLSFPRASSNIGLLII